MVVGIQEINPTIKYVKGEHNVVADGLSIIGAVRRCEKIYWKLWKLSEKQNFQKWSKKQYADSRGKKTVGDSGDWSCASRKMWGVYNLSGSRGLFSKWTELFALWDTRAETICKIILDKIILRYGVPTQISDAGSQFTGAIFKNFCIDNF